jgi:CRISPR-associated endonuclease Cas1
VDGGVGSALPVRSDWSERAEHWRDKTPTPRKHALQRRKLRAPLVLSGFGIFLRINHGALEVRDGFTHYPQKQAEYRFFPGDQQRPSRIIVLEQSGAITFNVLAWLAEQDIPLIQLDYRGRVVTVVGGAGHAANPQLTRAQLEASADPKRKLSIASWLVREKLACTVRVLQELFPPSAKRAAAIEHLTRDAQMLVRRPAKALDDLLGIEGLSAALYFQCWHDIPIKWKALDRHPIPDDWHRIGPRSSARKRDSNRSVSHPVQAMLNYAYTVLEGQVRTEVIRSGLDVSIGFLHQMRPARPALVLDLMETARTMADRAVLTFVHEQIFSPADFKLTPNGTCRLHPQLARRVVGLVNVGDEIQPLLAELTSKTGRGDRGGGVRVLSRSRSASRDARAPNAE